MYIVGLYIYISNVYRLYVFTTWNALCFSRHPITSWAFWGHRVSKFCFVDQWKQIVSDVFFFFPFRSKAFWTSNLNHINLCRIHKVQFIFLTNTAKIAFLLQWFYLCLVTENNFISQIIFSKTTVKYSTSSVSLTTPASRKGAFNKTCLSCAVVI